mmetsp:Transcript_374/g.268  ORF Transcript_374/g.268 Transcript_374/m.268 type:complete len:419 (-) Transcript_374:455-1711(-)
MRQVAFMLACLAYDGHGRRVQQDQPGHQVLPKLLETVPAAAAFTTFVAGAPPTLGMTGGKRNARRVIMSEELAATSQQTDESTQAEAESPCYHIPVLSEEAVHWLITDPAGTYVDGTLGGGGHSAALLEVLEPNGGHLIGIDRDPDALSAAGERLQAHVAAGRATLVHSNFGALPEALRGVEVGTLVGSSKVEGMLDGILLDLGVSSHQIDDGSRGFSYMHDGPLDMRMDQESRGSIRGSARTAHEILNEWEVQQISDVLRFYGEEPESWRIAQAIVKARPLSTTADLTTVVRAASSRKTPKEVRSRLSRIFQALRIEVNQEMRSLEDVLKSATQLVRPGGRIAVMSYHSLEDRRVKNLLRSGGFSNKAPPKDYWGNPIAPWKVLTRKAVVPSEEEIKSNPRARSVRLRVGERTEHSL